MKWFATLLLAVSTQAFAGKISVQNFCAPGNALEQYFELNGGISVGDLTINFLKQENISFEGNARWIHSIMGSPIGMEAIENSFSQRYARLWLVLHRERDASNDRTCRPENGLSW